LKDYRAWAVEMELLVVHPLPWILEAAKKANIKIVTWAPAWVHQIWMERDKYWTPDAVEKREFRKSVLKRLGFT